MSTEAVKGYSFLVSLMRYELFDLSAQNTESLRRRTNAQHHYFVIFFVAASVSELPQIFVSSMQHKVERL